MTKKTTKQRIPHAARVSHVDDLLKQLRMPHARAQVPALLRAASTQDWDHTELLAELFGAEITGRAAKMAATRRRKARLPTGKTFETWDPAESSLPLATQRGLRTLEWVHRLRKPHAHRACRDG